MVQHKYKWALLTNCIPEAEKVNFAAAPSNCFTASSNVLSFMPYSSFSYGTFILMHNSCITMHIFTNKNVTDGSHKF